jgi:predicted RND superfamily exporter protein
MAAISDRVGDVAVRVSDRVVAHAWPVLVFSWILAVACAIVTSRLPLQGDFSALLPPKTESVQHLRALEKRTLVLASYMVGIESDDPAQRAGAAQMLRERFEAIDPRLVSGVTADDDAARQFAYKNRFLFAPLDQLVKAHAALDKKIADVDPMYLSLDDDDANGATTDDLSKWMDDAKKEADTSGVFVSKDGRLQMILVRTTFDAGDEKGQELNAILNGAIAEARAAFPHATVGMAGDVISTQAEHRALVKGVLESTLATMALVIAAIVLFYGSWSGVGALCWSLVVGVLATFAFTEISIGQLNLASGFLSSIVIGNGINCGLLLLARYMEERYGSAPPDVALRAAVRGAAPGTLMATLTAMVAYASLAITDFRGFRDFGIIGAAGMFLCWVSAFTVLPAALTVVGARVKGRDPARLGAVVARFLPERPRVVAAVGLVLLGLTTLSTARYLTHEPLENDLRNLRSENADLDAEGAWMAKFDKAFGNGIEGGFVIGVKEPGEARVVEEKLRSVDDGKPEIAHLFSRISSLDDALPKDQSEKLVELAKLRDLVDTGFVKHLSDEDQKTLHKLRPPDDLRALTYADVPARLAWPYTERDGTRGRFVLANTGLGVDTWRTTSLEHFARVVRGLKLGPDVQVGGSAFVFSDMLAAMQHDGPIATFASILGSVLVVLFVLGGGRNARITLACAGLGVMGMLTAAWLLNIKVNFLDFVALPITVGIGVDYGVNIVARAAQVKSTGAVHAGRRALLSTGPVVMLCSYTTMVGYASLLFSQNRGIRSFGLSAMLGELTCISAAMLLAPALIDYGTTSAKSA